MNSHETGKNGERAVYFWLRNLGIKAHFAADWAPFDLYTSAGTSLEVKTAYPSKKKSLIGWRLNIERHGKMCQEHCVDFYIFRLETVGELLQGHGFGKALHVVVPATQVKSKNVWIGVRTLLTRWATKINAVSQITDSDQLKTDRDAAVTLLQAKRRSSLAARFKKKNPPSESQITQATTAIAKEKALAQDRARLIEKVQEESAEEARLILGQGTGI